MSYFTWEVKWDHEDEIILYRQKYPNVIARTRLQSVSNYFFDLIFGWERELKMKKKETRYKNNWFYLQFFFFFFFFCCNCTLAIFSCQEKKIWSRWWCQYGYPWNLMFILCRNHFSVLEGPLTIKNKCFQSIIYTHKTLENPLLKSFTIIIMIGGWSKCCEWKIIR